MKISLYILFLSFSLASCNKEVKVAVNGGIPNFNVTLSSKTFKVGEDIVFNLEGKADVISFFSGELYREYAFKDSRILDLTNPSFSFTSAVTGGTQTNQLTIMASTNFNGVYNDTLKAPLTDIHAATWVDITSRFALGTTATYLASGAKSVSDLVVAGKPLYLAFKYVTKPQAVNGVARSWMIQSFALTGAAAAGGSPVGTLTLADLTNAGFRIVDGSPTTAPTKSAVAATRITLLGNAYTATDDPLTETWAITRALSADKIDTGPDYPVGIKGIANPTLTSYTYKYAKAGTYKIHFIASNANAYESETVVKDLEITVTP